MKPVAGELGVVSIVAQRNEVVIRFAEGVRHTGTNLMRIVRSLKGRVTLGAGRALTFKIRTQGLSEKELLNILVYVITEMNEACEAASQ
jgi:hypothetical protein